MDKLKEHYATLQPKFKQAKTIDYDYRLHPDVDMPVVFLFQMMGTESTQIWFRNALKKVFPVKAVDAYLAKHSEKVHKITLLLLEFNPGNSVEVLEMVANRFPKIERLNLRYALNHPVEHLFAQFHRMPNLVEINFARYRLRNVFAYIHENHISPLPKVTKFECGCPCQYDLYEHFEATIPVLFPNLVDLVCLCPSKEFTHKLNKNVRMLFPKLQKCQAIYVGDVFRKIAEKSQKEHDDAVRKGIFNAVNSRISDFRFN